jgi:hypothetical protein
LGSTSFGDPALVWRKLDGKFYFATLSSAGLGIWRSDDDCQTFTFVATIASGSDDKELMAVDNNPASPFYGRLYVAWTDFGSGARIYSTFSSNGGATWSVQLALSAAGVDVQGAWPTVAPNGDVWVASLRWNPWPSGPMDIEVARSTNGGTSYTLVANPMTGGGNPQDATATGNCGRPALKGNIRYLPSPQIASKGKSFTPKDWLEVETELKVMMAPEPKSKTCDRLTITWYVAVDNPEKSGTYLKFKREIEHVNIPLGEKIFCSVYLSPASIRRLTGSDRAGKSSVKAVGFEISVDGAVVATESSAGGKWWADPKAAAKFSDSEVVPLLSKPETPFAMMWWDAYAEVKPAAAR